MKRISTVAFRAGWVILLACFPYIWLRSCSGRVVQYQLSPDAKTVAQVEWFTSAAATDGPSVAVRLRRRFNPMWDCVFSSDSVNAAQVTLSWIDARNLKVTCRQCDKFDRRSSQMEPRWNDVNIHYDIQNWFNPQEKAHRN